MGPDASYGTVVVNMMIVGLGLGPTMPVFTLAGRVMTVDGQTVPNERFEEVNEPAV